MTAVAPGLCSCGEYRSRDHQCPSRPTPQRKLCGCLTTCGCRTRPRGKRHTMLGDATKCPVCAAERGAAFRAPRRGELPTVIIRTGGQR